MDLLSLLSRPKAVLFPVQVRRPEEKNQLGDLILPIRRDSR